jgi:hypothetical protein
MNDYRTIVILCDKPEHARKRFEREIQLHSQFNCVINHETMTISFPGHELNIVVMCSTPELRGMKIYNIVLDESRYL